MTEWWTSFFDEDYLAVWGGMVRAERTMGEVDGLVRVLGLAAGARVLDAPCGFGRLSRPLAERGFEVLGVDQSQTLLARARADQEGALPRLRYLHHDLRRPLPEGGFDAALNIFSSIGYGTEEEDVAMLSHLRAAVHEDGQVVVETMHRDAIVARIGRGADAPAQRLPDGTLILEEPSFDAVTGRVETCWRWWGPRGRGEKRASLRVYCATELVRLFRQAGLSDVQAQAGYSGATFRLDRDGGGRLLVVGRR